MTDEVVKDRWWVIRHMILLRFCDRLEAFVKGGGTLTFPNVKEALVDVLKSINLEELK